RRARTGRLEWAEAGAWRKTYDYVDVATGPGARYVDDDGHGELELRGVLEHCHQDVGLAAVGAAGGLLTDQLDIFKWKLPRAAGAVASGAESVRRVHAGLEVFPDAQWLS